MLRNFWSVILCTKSQHLSLHFFCAEFEAFFFLPKVLTALLKIATFFIWHVREISCDGGAIFSMLSQRRLSVAQKFFDNDKNSPTNYFSFYFSICITALTWTKTENYSKMVMLHFFLGSICLQKSIFRVEVIQKK